MRRLQPVWLSCWRKAEEANENLPEGERTWFHLDGIFYADWCSFNVSQTLMVFSKHSLGGSGCRAISELPRRLVFSSTVGLATTGEVKVLGGVPNDYEEYWNCLLYF